MIQHVLMHKESGDIYLGIKINYFIDDIAINVYKSKDFIFSSIKRKLEHDAWIILEPISSVWLHCNRDSIEKDYLEVGEL